jgi:uncharacterized protein YbjT (DUF2867 family)
MPLGTQIDVGDAIIGYSGSTGLVTGPHLHVQKMVDNVFVHPHGAGLGNDLAFPATVIEVGQNAEVGKYVRLVDVNGVRWSYFHQSETKAKVGQVIQGGNMPTLVDKNIAADLAAAILFREGAAQTDPAYLKSVVGQPVEDVIRALLHSEERKAVQDRLNAPKGLTPDQQTKVKELIK